MELDPRTRASVAAYGPNAQAYQAAFRRSRPTSDLRRFADRAERGRIVLDLGCGPANDLRMLSDIGLHPIGVDLSLGALQFARVLQPRQGLLNAALHDIPVKDGCAGALWMSSSFTHLPRAQWAPTFAAVLTKLDHGPVYFSCYRGEADMEPIDDQLLGEVHRSQATEDEIERMFLAHGFQDLSIEIRPDPLVDRRRPWVVALGTK